MTKDNQPTPEQIEKARSDNVKKTLENKLFQSVLGSNLVKTNPFTYGELGLSGAEVSYDQSTSESEFGKIRQGIYQNQLDSMRKDGVYGEPNMPSNGQISQKIVRQIREVTQMAKLGELEKYAKEAGASLEFQVPEELKNYTFMELAQKGANSEGRVDMNKLTEKEKDAIKIYGLLQQTYERSCALKSCKSGYFLDMNQEGKSIVEKYKPKK